MASGGMGDVLTGIIAGFITQGYSPESAAHAGVYLHGATADLLKEKGIVEKDNQIIITRGDFLGEQAGGTNAMKIVTIGDVRVSKN